MKISRLIATLLGASLASSAAFAERAATYVFIDGIYSDIATDIGDASAVDPARLATATDNWSIDPAKPVFSKGDVSDPDAGARIGGGMDFAEHWGIEVSMALFGEGTDTLRNNINGDIEVSTKARTFSVDVLRYFALTDQFSLYGRLGIDAWTVDIRARQLGKDVDRDRDSGYMPSIGLGARLDLGDAWSIRAEVAYRTYNADFTQYETRNNPSPKPGDNDVTGRYADIAMDVDVTSFSLGIARRF